MKKETAVVSYEQKAVSEFSITPAEVAEKAKEFLALKVLQDDAKTYKTAREALTLCVSYRTSTDKRRKELGEDARKWINTVNQAQRNLIAPLAPAEEYLRTELQIEDGRQKAVKAEKARKERERVEAIRAKIAGIKLMVFESPGKNAQQIQDLIAENSFIEVTEDVFQEFTEEAQRVLTETTTALNSALQARIKWEEEQAERHAEADRLRKIRVEQEAEAAKQATERAKLEAEKKALEDAKRAEQERKDREEFEKRAKEEARIQAEKDAKEKAEREVRETKAREEKEAAEKARAEALKPDKEKLVAWANKILDITLPKLSELELQAIASNCLDGIYEEARLAIQRVEAL